ncbi:hypothetical protein QOT17_017460 [Balamuthia mandrillaris]
MQKELPYECFSRSEWAEFGYPIALDENREDEQHFEEDENTSGRREDVEVASEEDEASIDCDDRDERRDNEEQIAYKKFALDVEKCCERACKGPTEPPYFGPREERELGESPEDLYLMKWIKLAVRFGLSRAELTEILGLAREGTELWESVNTSDYHLCKLQETLNHHGGTLIPFAAPFLYTSSPSVECYLTGSFLLIEWHLKQAFNHPVLAAELGYWREASEEAKREDIFGYKAWKEESLLRDNPWNVVLLLFFDDYNPAKVQSDILNWWTLALLSTCLLKQYGQECFFAPYRNELQKRLAEGVKVWNRYTNEYIHVKVKVICCSSDLPAKALLTNSQASWSSMKAWCM